MTTTAEPVERVLFSLDDHSIPFTHNLRLEMQRPVKHAGNPVVERGGPNAPDRFGVQFYGSVVRHDGLFKMWYVAVDESINREDPFAWAAGWRPAYAESEDGVAWRKPNLGLVDYEGSTENNLVALQPAPVGMINLKVIVDDDDPDPARRFKMVGHTWWIEGDGRGRGTLCPFTSPDGLTWHIAADIEPDRYCIPKEHLLIPPHHFEAAGGLYQWNGMFYATGQSGPPAQHGGRPYSGREIVIHRSADFRSWSTTATLAFVREGQHKSFTYGEGEESHEGVSVWNRGNVLLGLYGIWHGADDWSGRSIDLGLLISNDGRHFREPVTEHVFLERGPDGTWDQGGLIQGQGFENVGEETLIYYGAWDPRAFAPYEARGGVGIAVLPRDRLAALTPNTGSGASVDCTSACLVTDGFIIPPIAEIYANVDGLGPDSQLQFELLNDREEPIWGFSGTDGGIVREDGFRVPVVWRGDRGIRGVTGKVKIRVRFHGTSCESARLYAIYVVSCD